MMNKVELMGRLTSDPELKTTPSNISVTSFSIAVERNYAKQDEARQTDFINIVCWRQRAEFVCKYFVKGQLIALVGSLQTRSYEDKNGNKRVATEVLAENIYFTGDKRSIPDNQPSEIPPLPGDDDFTEMPIDDDLPY
ncbi:MAG: single-stranded DNA-binding protein [Acutalibacteraceae bacterium]